MKKGFRIFRPGLQKAKLNMIPLSGQDLGSLVGINVLAWLRQAISASCCLHELDFALDIADRASLLLISHLWVSEESSFIFMGVSCGGSLTSPAAILLSSFKGDLGPAFVSCNI